MKEKKLVLNKYTKELNNILNEKNEQEKINQNPNASN